MPKAISIRLFNIPRNILSKMPGPAPVKSLDARLKVRCSSLVICGRVELVNVDARRERYPSIRTWCLRDE